MEPIRRLKTVGGTKPDFCSVCGKLLVEKDRFTRPLCRECWQKKMDDAVEGSKL